MKHFTRLTQSLSLAALTLLGTSALRAQFHTMAPLGSAQSPMLLTVSHGYLGVELADIDQEKAQALKLKEVRGALVTLIDHDAPAALAGLKVNDIVLKLNGQPVEGAEQLRRMLHEIPAGRKVTLDVYRDGNTQALTVELANRKLMEHGILDRLGTSEMFSSAPGLGLFGSTGDVPFGSGFHLPFFGSTLNVGALVEPLTTQMAEYLGVPSGLMVKQVARKSEADAAGLRAFDVILKLGQEPIKTLADWDRLLRSNQGKPVQVTILRDRKLQTLALQVDSHHHSQIEWEKIYPGEGSDALVGVEPNAVFTEIGAMHLSLSPEQNNELHRQMEQFEQELKASRVALDAMKLTPRQAAEMRHQMDALKKQMREFARNLTTGEI